MAATSRRRTAGRVTRWKDLPQQAEEAMAAVVLAVTCYLEHGGEETAAPAALAALAVSVLKDLGETARAVAFDERVDAIDRGLAAGAARPAARRRGRGHLRAV